MSVAATATASLLKPSLFSGGLYQLLPMFMLGWPESRNLLFAPSFSSDIRLAHSICGQNPAAIDIISRI